MIEDVTSRGRKMVTIVDPHVKKDGGYPIFKEAGSQELLREKKRTGAPTLTGGAGRGAPRTWT